MKKELLLSIFSFLLLIACSPKDKTASTESDNAHVAQNSLDWNGMYKGITPCADCEGIETILVLNADNTYLLRTKYLGKENDKIHEKTGSLIWTEAGNTVVLSAIENAPNQYFVAENQLIQLDMSGKRITGDLAEKYVLDKQ